MLLDSNEQNCHSTQPDFAIRVKNGVAVITGTAATITEKMRAEAVVSELSDVTQVHNLLKTCSD